MTDLSAYLAFLTQIGFREIPATRLQHFLYLSNIPPNTYMLDEAKGVTFVFVSSNPSSNTYFEMQFRDGKLHSYGSHE